MLKFFLGFASQFHSFHPCLTSCMTSAAHSREATFCFIVCLIYSHIFTCSTLPFVLDRHKQDTHFRRFARPRRVNDCHTYTTLPFDIPLNLP